MAVANAIDPNGGSATRRRIVMSSILGLGIAVWGVTTNIASSFGSIAPAIALAVSPSDARALGRKAAMMVKLNAANPEAVRLARSSILHDPNVISNYVLLALDPRRPEAERNKALEFSRKLSRRDQATTFILLQNALKQDDLAGFFKQFDIAMRTSTKAEETFSPVVVRAMSDDRVVQGLAKSLRERPRWGRAFILSAINGAPSARKAHMLVSDLMSHGIEIDRDYIGVLIGRLANEGEYQEAWTTYKAAFPREASRLMRPLLRVPKVATPFDWILANEADKWGQVEGTAESPILRYSANAGAAGVVARQIVVLKPGSYVLSYKAETNAGTAFRARWTATCGGGEALAAADATKTGAMAFTVPTGCPAVVIQLTATADLNVSENQGSLEQISLRPSLS